MALIACPDCQTHISDAAPACPRCGRPIAATPQPQWPQPQQQWQPQAPVQVKQVRPSVWSDTGIANTAGRGCLIMLVGLALLIGLVKLVSYTPKPMEVNGVPVTK